MDNRINQIRRKISSLREKMLNVEASMHDQVAHDLDCAETATVLLGLRAEMAGLVAERGALGDQTPISLPEVRKSRFRR
jgi:hypothetical protein